MKANSIKKTQFENECTIINLRYEYPGYVGKEKWAIITELNLQEILKKYEEEVKSYRPFIVLTRKHADIFKEFNSNDRKHSKRQADNGEMFGYESNNSEQLCLAGAYKDMESDVLSSMRIQEALSVLNSLQRKRFVKKYIEGYTLREIAQEEDVNYAAVASSLKIAKEKIKKFLK